MVLHHQQVQHKLFCLWLCSNFQTRLLGSSHANMSQHQEEYTVTAVLNCRTQKQLEVTSKLCFSFVIIFFFKLHIKCILLAPC